MVAIAVVVALGMVLMGGVALGMVVWNEGRRCLPPKKRPPHRPTTPPQPDQASHLSLRGLNQWVFIEP